MPHFVFVNSKGLAEKCIGSSLAAVTDPQNGIRRHCGRCVTSARAGCWKPSTEAVISLFLHLSFSLSLVGQTGSTLHEHSARSSHMNASYIVSRLTFSLGIGEKLCFWHVC